MRRSGRLVWRDPRIRVTRLWRCATDLLIQAGAESLRVHLRLPREPGEDLRETLDCLLLPLAQLHGVDAQSRTPAISSVGRWPFMASSAAVALKSALRFFRCVDMLNPIQSQ